MDAQGQLKLWRVISYMWNFGCVVVSIVQGSAVCSLLQPSLLPGPSSDCLSSPRIPHFRGLLVGGVPVGLTDTWDVYIQMSIFPSRYPTRHCIRVRAFESLLRAFESTLLSKPFYTLPYILVGRKLVPHRFVFLGTCKSALTTEVLQKGESCLIRFWGKVR